MPAFSSLPPTYPPMMRYEAHSHSLPCIPIPQPMNLHPSLTPHITSPHHTKHYYYYHYSPSPPSFPAPRTLSSHKYELYTRFYSRLLPVQWDALLSSSTWPLLSEPTSAMNLTCRQYKPCTTDHLSQTPAAHHLPNILLTISVLGCVVNFIMRILINVRPRLGRSLSEMVSGRIYEAGGLSETRTRDEEESRDEDEDVYWCGKML